MPTDPNNVTDVKNWPNLIFKYFIGLILGALFILGTALVSELKELNKTMQEFKEGLSGMTKDYGYLVERVDDIETTQNKHIERAEAKILEHDRKIDRLEFQIKPHP